MYGDITYDSCGRHRNHWRAVTGIAPLHTQRALDVDEITFHKHSPRLGDRAKITNLMRRGARLAVDAEKRTDFEKLGLQPTYTTEEALAQATVVIDCTSDGLGLAHKRDWYEHLPRAQGFIAQGSETGFGKMYARGINDEALVPGEDRFVQWLVAIPIIWPS